MSKRLVTTLFVFIFLSACNQRIKETMGLVDVSPDEFTVAEERDLEVPPNFYLTPPKPGEKNRGHQSSRDMARNITKPLITEKSNHSQSAKQTLSPSLSAAEQAFLNKIPGEDHSNTGRLDLMKDEQSKESKGFLDSMFSKYHKNTEDILDPSQEAKRLNS